MLSETVVVVPYCSPVAIASAQNEVLVWDVINVCPDLGFVTLGVKELSILNGLADRSQQVEPDLRLNIDIDLDRGPNLVAGHRLLRSNRASATREHQKKQARNQNQRSLNRAASQAWFP